MNLRIGNGYDLHRCIEGRRLVLGGVEIPHERGLLGHSDADVLTHALIDALLGAAALGDIGQHFPPSDARYRDIQSLELLRRCLPLLQREGWQIVNLDATVIAERPRLGPFIPRMRAALAAAAGIDLAQVSLKAKTNEGLGALGNGEAIAALAVALLGRDAYPR